MEEREDLAVESAVVWARCLSQTWTEYLHNLEAGLETFMDPMVGLDDHLAGLEPLFI